MRPERVGVVREETAEERQERAARQSPAPTPLEIERAEREHARRTERAARWEAGCKREGLWGPMITIEQRLAELPAVQKDLSRRQAMAPRLVTLLQDAVDEGLGIAWERRILDLHRLLIMEPTLVANAAAAQRLLDDIQTFDPDDFDTHAMPNSIVHVANPNLFAEWRRQLTWYTPPLPAPSAEEFGRQVAQLEGEVLAVIRQRREDDRDRFGPRDEATGRFRRVTEEGAQ
jgi:hypothetical protein